MSWYRFECVTKWQNKPYTNNANPQFFCPVKIAPAAVLLAGFPRKQKTDKTVNPELDKLVKTFCPVNAGKYRK